MRHRPEQRLAPRRNRPPAMPRQSSVPIRSSVPLFPAHPVHALGEAAVGEKGFGLAFNLTLEKEGRSRDQQQRGVGDQNGFIRSITEWYGGAGYLRPVDESLESGFVGDAQGNEL